MYRHLKKSARKTTGGVDFVQHNDLNVQKLKSRNRVLHESGMSFKSETRFFQSYFQSRFRIHVNSGLSRFICIGLS